MEKANITIVGAGVVGLAVAAELAGEYRDVFIVEKNPAYGQETSSRNSEVIHAGIYYPADSLKTRTCREGNRLLYDFCLKNHIPHRKIGKLVVAVDKSELKSLESLFQQGRANGVGDLKLLSGQEVEKIEPRVKSAGAIYSPSTGIIDSHGLMQALAGQFKERGGNIACESELVGIEKSRDGFELEIKNKKGETFKFQSRAVINCAGLNSDKVAAMAGLNKKEYKINYSKGDYFRVRQNKAAYIQRLVYPLPGTKCAGLGIHATLDLAGGLRLGPDDAYVQALDYNIDEAKKVIFYQSVKTFLPFVELDDLAADTSGIRPKLQGPGEDFRDFIIQDETENNRPGLINLIGIESPGLTSALAIARMVKGLAEQYF